MDRTDDTTPEAAAARREVLRRMSPARKAQMIAACVRASRQLLRAGLRQRYPEASEEELLDRFRRATLGDELTDAAYGRPAAE